MKLMRKLLKNQEYSPDAVVADKLPSYGRNLPQDRPALPEGHN